MRLGIVLEGGANRAIFSCGVLDAFLEREIFPDYFIGTSAGIGDGISYISRQKGRNLEILTRFMRDSRYLSFRNLINPRNRSPYGLKFVFEDVPRDFVPFDYDAFAHFASPCLAVVTNVETGLAEYIDVPRRDGRFDVLKASCAMPLIFPMISYGGKKYLDGGVTDPIPFQKALLDGCDKLIVVLTRERAYEKGAERFTGLIRARYRSYPNLINAMQNRVENYNKTRAALFALEKAGGAYVITPDSTSDFSRLERDPVKLRRMYDHGLSKGLAEADGILKFIKSGAISGGGRERLDQNIT